MSGKITDQELADGAVTSTKIASGVAETNLGFTPENTANKGIANGYASLGADGKVPSTQMGATGANLLTSPSAWIG